MYTLIFRLNCGFLSNNIYIYFSYYMTNIEYRILALSKDLKDNFFELRLNEN